MTSFESFLYNYSRTPLYVIKGYTNYNTYGLLDLSFANKDLNTISNAEEFENYIHSMLEKQRKKVAYGGYQETRIIYKRSSHFNKKKHLRGA
jgi:hypothetical protein